MLLSDCPLGKSMGHFLACWLMWKAEHSVHSAIPGQVVLEWIRKRIEKAIKNHSSLASASGSASRFLSLLSSVVDCNLWNKINPFLNWLLLAKGVYHRNQNLRTQGQCSRSSEPQFEVYFHVSQELLSGHTPLAPWPLLLRRLGCPQWIGTQPCTKGISCSVPVPGWDLNKLPKKKKSQRKGEISGYSLNAAICYLVAGKKHGDRHQAVANFHSGKDLIDGHLPKASLEVNYSVVLCLYPRKK